jgi:hypothetical protein
MTEPDINPAEQDEREGNLGQLTHEDWLAAHEALIASGALPPEETKFLYDPERDPDTVTVDDLTEDGVPRD